MTLGAPVPVLGLILPLWGLSALFQRTNPLICLEGGLLNESKLHCCKMVVLKASNRFWQSCTFSWFCVVGQLDGWVFL